MIIKLKDIFVPTGFSASETEEMIENIPSEIINVIVGLSLSSFPNRGHGLITSTPYTFKEEQLLQMSEDELEDAVKINTQSGYIICYISDKNTKGVMKLCGKY
jgi:hypothetical protein